MLSLYQLIICIYLSTKYVYAKSHSCNTIYPVPEQDFRSNTKLFLDLAKIAIKEAENIEESLEPQSTSETRTKMEELDWHFSYTYINKDAKTILTSTLYNLMTLNWIWQSSQSVLSPNINNFMLNLSKAICFLQRGVGVEGKLSEKSKEKLNKFVKMTDRDLVLERDLVMIKHVIRAMDYALKSAKT